MVSVKAAAERLGVPVDVVRILMKQNRVNIGYVIRRKSRNTYCIVEDLLEREIERRKGGTPMTTP